MIYFNILFTLLMIIFTVYFYSTINLFLCESDYYRYIYRKISYISMYLLAIIGFIGIIILLIHA